MPRAYAEFEVSQIVVQTLGEGEGMILVGDLRPARQMVKRGYMDLKKWGPSRRGMSDSELILRSSKVVNLYGASRSIVATERHYCSSIMKHLQTSQTFRQ